MPGSLIACLWLSLAAPAAADETHAGTYRTAAATINASVDKWGEDCGPRPRSTTEPGGQEVRVEADGAHLRIRFPDRTLHTGGCWSPNRAVKLVSSTASDTHYQADCRTPKSESKRESGRYQVDVPSRGVLVLREESRYNWQLKQSSCVATVRMTQRLTSGRADSASAEDPSAAPKPACVPGSLSKLRLRPSHAQIEPGQRLCFTVQGTDREGCPLDDGKSSTAKFALDVPPGAHATLSGHCFRAAQSAARGEGVFEVSAQRDGVRATATVVVATADLSDITATRDRARRAPRADSAAPDPGDNASSVGIRSAVPGSSQGWVLAGSVAAIFLLCALLVIRLRRRVATSARPSAPRPGSSSPRKSEKPSVAASVPRPDPPSGQPMICPTCRRGYAPGAERCTVDQTPLAPYATFAQQAAGEAKPCPKCGSQIAGDASFCGECGAHISA